MRLLFETTPVPATEIHKSGQLLKGIVFFQARAYVRGEQGSVSRHGTEAPRVSGWRERLAQNRLLLYPPSRHPEWPAVEIPANILQALPPDDLVVMEWIWKATR